MGVDAVTPPNSADLRQTACDIDGQQQVKRRYTTDKSDIGMSHN